MIFYLDLLPGDFHPQSMSEGSIRVRRTCLTFEEIKFVDEPLNFDFEKSGNTGRATMGMRFKNNFTAWREV